MKKFFIISGLSLLLAFSTFGESESESSQILLTSASGSNVDIDGNDQFDALTDGLLVLRSMFGLTGTSLISGAVAGDATYTDATDIESRITGLGNRLDIDDNGNIDALTDGLIVLRYLFGLTGDTLVKGVVAADANRVSAAEIEAHMAVLTSLDTEPPVITSSANYTAAENQTTIGTATATDANSASISFSVSGFDLEITSDGVLSFATAPDYETKSTYTAVITATDGTNSTAQSITVNVTDVDDVAPVFSSSATFSAAENQTAIGTVAATDADTSDSSISFTVSGSDLSITSAGVLTFASAPDYETKTSYTATVTATDGTNSTAQSITVNVTNLNDNSPVFTSSATFSAAENQTSIGTVTATDGDASDSVTFTVSGSELSITSAGVLTFASAPDYETKTSYTATVTATDGMNSTAQSITVNVTDVDDVAPAFSSSATFSAAENQTAIGTVTATDVDTDNSSISFTVSGSELSITSAGVLTFASAPDYETKTSYTATVTATDGTNLTTQSITVNVTNLNDNSPAFTSSETFSATENQTSIGTVTATDGDASDSVTFTVSGSELSITSAGVLTFASAPDYETKTSYTATVTATDGTNLTTQSITVNVTDVDDVAPAFSSSATFSAAENQTAIGTVTATDVDTDNSSISFTVSGSELSITSAGVLTFASAPDYETKTSYTATLTATDGTNSTTQSISISVTDVDEKPIITSSGAFYADENQKDIGSITATDESASLIYLLAGTHADDILINNSTGLMEFKNTPDYETRSIYSAIAQVYDDSFVTQVAFQVFINNLNEYAPQISSPSTFTVDENQLSVGTVNASDADQVTVTYTLSGTDSNTVEVNSSSGVITFKSNPDYESKTTYNFIVSASDGEKITTQAVTVNLNNLNDNAPVFSSSANLSVDENKTAISTVSATDADGNTLSYSLSGTDASVISINSSTGAMVFNSAPDYEMKTSYSVIVTATDGVFTSNETVTISINNIQQPFQIGSTLIGDQETVGGDTGSYLGYMDSIRLSSDGSKLVVGLPAHNTNNNGTINTDDGIVKVFQLSNGEWVQIGADISPTLTESGSSANYCGSSVDISQTGDRVAIGCPYGIGGDNLEDVFIFKYASNNWTQEGRLSRPFRGSWFGNLLRMNDDGTTVTTIADGNSSQEFWRAARNLSSSSWSFNGDRISTNHGRGMDMSSSGDFFAIGHERHYESGTNKYRTGRVEVYKVAINSGIGVYTQLSNDLIGNNAYDEFGHNLAMSSPDNTDGDGLVIAIGSPGYESDHDINVQNCPSDIDYGKVDLVRYSASADSFSSIGVIYGKDVDGIESCDQFSSSFGGSSIDLSDDGTILAVSGRNANGGVGAIYIYKYISATWSLKYKIPGNASIFGFGTTLDLSSDGLTLVTSLYAGASGKGEVKVYDLKEIF